MRLGDGGSRRGGAWETGRCGARMWNMEAPGSCAAWGGPSPAAMDCRKRSSPLGGAAAPIAAGCEAGDARSMDGADRLVLLPADSRRGRCGSGVRGGLAALPAGLISRRSMTPRRCVMDGRRPVEIQPLARRHGPGRHRRMTRLGLVVAAQGPGSVALRWKKPGWRRGPTGQEVDRGWGWEIGRAHV